MFINVKVIGNCCFLKSYNAFDYWFYLLTEMERFVMHIRIKEQLRTRKQHVSMCLFFCLLLASFHLTKIVTGGLSCFTMECPQKEEENINHIDIFLSNYDCPKLQIQNVNSKKKRSFICNALTTWTCQSLVSCFCHLNVEKAAK